MNWIWIIFVNPCLILFSLCRMLFYLWDVCFCVVLAVPSFLYTFIMFCSARFDCLAIDFVASRELFAFRALYLPHANQIVWQCVLAELRVYIPHKPNQKHHHRKSHRSSNIFHCDPWAAGFKKVLQLMAPFKKYTRVLADYLGYWIVVIRPLLFCSPYTLSIWTCIFWQIFINLLH